MANFSKILRALGMGLGGAGQIYGTYQKQKQKEADEMDKREMEQQYAQDLRGQFGVDDELPQETSPQDIYKYLAAKRAQEQNLIQAQMAPQRKYSQQLLNRLREKQLEPSFDDLLKDILGVPSLNKQKDRFGLGD
jgi:hypothetical protein